MLTKRFFQASRHQIQTPGKRFFQDIKHRYRPILARVEDIKKDKSRVTILHMETDDAAHHLQLTVRHHLSPQIMIEGNIPTTQISDLPAYQMVESKTLYGISQHVWGQYISKLNNDITGPLGLEENRGLLHGYNIAVASESPVEMATWLGKLHFLQDILLREEACLAAFELPSEAKTQLEANFQQLLINLKAGSFSEKDLYALCPAFTPLFVEKIRGHLDFDDIARLASLIMHFASTGNSSKLNLEKLHQAINLIPSSLTDLESFETFLQLRKTLGPNHSGLFFHLDNKWPQHTPRVLREMKETDFINYIDNLFGDLIWPEILRRHPHADARMIAEIKTEFCQFMEDSCAIHQINALQREWHRCSKNLDVLKPGLPAKSDEKKPVVPYGSLTQEEIFQFYRNNNLLPWRLKWKDYREMMQETGWQQRIAAIKPASNSEEPERALDFSL